MFEAVVEILKSTFLVQLKWLFLFNKRLYFLLSLSTIKTWLVLGWHTASLVGGGSSGFSCSYIKVYLLHGLFIQYQYKLASQLRYQCNTDLMLKSRVTGLVSMWQNCSLTILKLVKSSLNVFLHAVLFRHAAFMKSDYV